MTARLCVIVARRNDASQVAETGFHMYLQLKGTRYQAKVLGACVMQPLAYPGAGSLQFIQV